MCDGIDEATDPGREEEEEEEEGDATEEEEDEAPSLAEATADDGVPLA